MTSWTFLIFDDLNSFKEYWWDVLNTIPQLGFAWCDSHGCTVVVSVGEETLRGDVPSLSHHIKGTYYQHHSWSWYHLAEVMLSDFSTVQLLSLCLSVLYILEGSHFVQPMFERGIMLHLLESCVSIYIIWNYFTWDIWFVSSFPIFFKIHSVIYLYH